MKTIRFVIFSFLMMIVTCFNVNAQNYHTPLSAQIDSSGIMKNQEGVIFVMISSDSIIINTKGEMIAFIDRNGNLVSKEGKILGGTSINGDFYNLKNEVEYTVLPYKNGIRYNVYDKTGYQVLSVPANYKSQAGSLAYVHKNMLISR